MAKAIQVNDHVAYSKAWLKSVGLYTGDIPRAKGVVTEIKMLGKELAIATVEWDRPGIPEKVNVKNLAKVNSREYSD